MCITDSPALAGEVAEAFSEEAAAAARSGIIAEAAGRHGAVVVTESLDAARRLADEFAAEHLSLQGEAAEALRDGPHTASAVFVGRRSPVSMGDYVAGPNHTLPTGGAARYRGPALGHGLPALAVGGRSLGRGVRRPVACRLRSRCRRGACAAMSGRSGSGWRMVSDE